MNCFNSSIWIHTGPVDQCSTRLSGAAWTEAFSGGTDKLSRTAQGENKHVIISSFIIICHGCRLASVLWAGFKELNRSESRLLREKTQSTSSSHLRATQRLRLQMWKKTQLMTAEKIPRLTHTQHIHTVFTVCCKMFCLHWGRWCWVQSVCDSQPNHSLSHPAPFIPLITTSGCRLFKLKAFPA